MPAPGAVDVRARLAELARVNGGPIVSVYLNTRWTDEHQRERVRVFLKRELRRAREAAGPALAAALDWIGEQGEALVEQTRLEDAHGVALFAGPTRGLREVIPLRGALEDAFVVADRPFLAPLATSLADSAPALVVFVDGARARLIPLDAEGPGEEVRLAHDVEGRHARGGWAQLAQARYQRHIAAQRDRHFEAVAEAIGELDAARGIESMVLAGEVRALAALRRHLPADLEALVVGTIAGAEHEPAAALAARAFELLRRDEAKHGALDAVLTEAAKAGRAAAGVAETLPAVVRGAVRRLYLLKGFARPGRECAACDALESGEAPACRACNGPTRPVELGAAAVARVIATGGSVEIIGAHDALARAGGMAARLRYRG